MRRLLPILALGLFLAPAPAHPGPDPFEDPELEPTPLSALREKPAALLGRPVRFVFQLREEVSDWNPYVTRFGPGDYARYEGWSDERFLWEKPVFEDPAPYLFARRGSVPELVLRNAQTYERYEVVARVRETFLGAPWIEIEHVRRLGEHVSAGTILHAVRGIEMRSEKRWDIALEQFERAGNGILPEHVRAELDRLVRECRRASRM